LGFARFLRGAADRWGLPSMRPIAFVSLLLPLLGLILPSVASDTVLRSYAGAFGALAGLALISLVRPCLVLLSLQVLTSVCLGVGSESPIPQMIFFLGAVCSVLCIIVQMRRRTGARLLKAAGQETGRRVG
jgi:hypothetical protein